MLSVSDYPHAKWQDKFPDNKVRLEPNIHSSWIPLFSKLMADPRFEKLEAKLAEVMKSGVEIYPYPGLLFSAFRATPLDDLKVVIIGQDPYFKSERGIPQAMGLSFSVPVGLDIPSSLININKNLVRFGHITRRPDHGNLEFWAYQGCLMLNTALSVSHNDKNSHANMWRWFTDAVIEYISREKSGIIFVLWGAPALGKLKLIDVSRHEVIISSHPSGLSCSKSLGEYPPFDEVDHFGKINEFLRRAGRQEIIFGL